MFIKQISAFIENKPGRLADITKYIADAGINILAISLADTTNFGILRLIAENPDKACEALKQHGLTVKTTDVVAVALENYPGSLARVLADLHKYDVSIEYMYAFTTRREDFDSMVILRLTNQDEAVKKLEEGAVIQMLGPDIVGQTNGN